MNNNQGEMDAQDAQGTLPPLIERVDQQPTSFPQASLRPSLDLNPSSPGQLPVCILSRDAALVLVELELSLDLLLLLNGAVESGLCAQLSLSAAFSDFRDGAIDDLAPLLDLGFSGNLNSVLYLSVGIDLLLDLLLVALVEVGVWGGYLFSLVSPPFPNFLFFLFSGRGVHFCRINIPLLVHHCLRSLVFLVPEFSRALAPG